MPKRIQRKRTKGWKMPEGAVYVGRPTLWGNPFKAGQRSRIIGLPESAEARAERRAFNRSSKCLKMMPPNRVVHFAKPLTSEEAVRWYAQYLRDTGLDRLAISRLRGKDLVCWCPLIDKDGLRVPCHADVLLELANK